MSKSIVLLGVPGNDSLEAWRCKNAQMRPYFVRGDAVPNMLARMIESGNYNVDCLDSGEVWCVEVKEKDVLV